LHSISHHKKDPEKLSSYQRINQFHVEQLAYVLRKMSRIDEGNGTTLLDNSIDRRLTDVHGHVIRDMAS